jgi:starch-binding outer membrane protein, SusD/RagB family
MKFILRITLIITLAACTIFYFSCDKSKLNVPPPTQTEISYFNSEIAFRTAIMGVYAVLTDYYSSSNSAGGFGSAELESFFLPGDDLTSQTEEVYEVFGNRLNSTESKIQQLWGSSYILCNRANKVLGKIETVEDGIYVTPNLKDYNKGEMLFLRGFAHYMLWNVFGTAPLDTADFSLENLNPPNTTGTQLLDQAISDFSQAASLLPPSWGDEDLGRVTKNAAYGMLGKALVFRATVNKNNEDYQSAIEAFNKITGASLTENFEDNFDVNTENNIESLFEFQAGPPIAGPGSTNSWLANDIVNIGVCSSYWQCFYNGAGTYMGGNLYVATNKFKNAFNTADPRLPLTINTDNNNILKYVLNGDAMEGQVNSLNNVRILRYADVLLLKAEAILQSGGSTSEAIELINDVRARARNMVAGGTEPANFSTAETNKNTIFQWIMDERLRELGAEGGRWFDVRRWALGNLITLNSQFFNSNWPSITWDDHFLNFPVPSTEIDKNPNIQQNTGY